MNIQDFTKGQLEALRDSFPSGYEFISKYGDYYIKQVIVTLDGKFHHEEFHCIDRNGRKWFASHECYDGSTHIDAISDAIDSLTQ